MLSVYPAIFYKESIGYSVIFPDLNYLATCGETLEEAFEMAVDCLAGHLYWIQLEGKTAPSPSSISERLSKKTLTIPAWLNKAALEQNINFSQVLQNALLDILGISVNSRKKGV